MPAPVATDWIGNQLVVIASRRTGSEFTPDAESLTWLAETEGAIAVGDPAHVPVGRYAREAFERLGLWDSIQPRIAAAVDARAALRFVERGECPFGLVYRSDAQSSAAVRVVASVPLGAASIRYRMLRLGDSPAALRLERALRDDRAMRRCRALGFAPPIDDQRSVPASNLDPATHDGWLPTSSEWAALWLSVRVGAVATLWVLIPGVALGYWLARTRSRWRSPIEALVLLPLVLPPVVVGFALLAWCGRGSAIGGWLESWFGLQLAFTWRAAALASAVLGFPLLVRTARSAFGAIDPGFAQAAATLGASRWRIFATITLPLAGRGLVAGLLLCFARSLGEFGATITFAANIAGETRTLPIAIWTELQRPGGEASAWRMTLLCVLVAVTATLLCELLVRRSVPGAMARGSTGRVT